MSLQTSTTFLQFPSSNDIMMSDKQYKDKQYKSSYALDFI